jgi:hypothetical protein
MLQRTNALDIIIPHLKIVAQVCVMKSFRVTVRSGVGPGPRPDDPSNICLDVGGHANSDLGLRTVTVPHGPDGPVLR